MVVGRLSQESPEYRKIRDELAQAEVALRDQRERVAELRRRLPTEEPVEDYLVRSAPSLLAHDLAIIARGVALVAKGKGY